MDEAQKKKLGKRGLKKATRAVDQLMMVHCHVKRTPWITVLFMSAAAYALHVQRKFSMLSEMDKVRMNTIGKKISKHAKGPKISINRKGE
jgi:hypothetical protein